MMKVAKQEGARWRVLSQAEFVEEYSAEMARKRCGSVWNPAWKIIVEVDAADMERATQEGVG